MGQYYKLKVKEVIKETSEAVTIVFNQHSETISYKSGQFLTLIFNINGANVRRSYSLCSVAELDKELAVTVKRVTNGLVSNYIADQVKIGDVIEVMEPMGIFTYEADYNKKRDIVLIGAGSGITPLMSIARSALHNEPLSNVYLLFGNRNENSIIFNEKLNALKEEHGDRFRFTHVLSQPLNVNYQQHGRLSRSIIIKNIESYSNLDVSSAEFYLCGPKGMMEEAESALNLLNVPATRVHKESFLSTPTEPVQGKVVPENQAGPKEVTIIYQGSEYKFIVPEDKTILHAALDQDIDLPYSCQSGMCTACMGKCTSGKVHLDDPDGLSDKEIQQGYVLTCVGHPVSSDVVIEIN